jgi:hypothetical protein
MGKLVIILAVFVSFSFSGPIETLQPNCWYEVPNSHLETIKVSSTQFPWVGNFGGIMDDWCGAAFDTQRDRLYVGPGGGHAGYEGNEVYAFDLNDLQWHRLNDPDASSPCAGTADVAPPVDIAPFAMHTYDRLEYIPAPVDKYFEVGGWCSSFSYWLDLTSYKWTKVAGLDGEGNVTNGMSALDPVTNTVWAGHGILQQFNPATKTWGKKTEYDNSIYWGRITLTCDPKRRLLVGVGVVDMGSGASVPATVTWDISNTSATIPSAKITTTGATDIMTGGQNGTEYDAASDRIVAWKGGSDVYSLDMDTKVWTKHTAANNVTPGSPNGNGTFGRFRYSPKKNVFVVVNSVSSNVFLYRLTAGTGIQAPSFNRTDGLIPLTLSPNPARTGIPVRIAAGKAAAIGISDLRGRKITSIAVKDGTAIWHPDALPAGLYLVTARVDGREISRKLLLEK